MNVINILLLTCFLLGFAVGAEESHQNVTQNGIALPLPESKFLTIFYHIGKPAETPCAVLFYTTDVLGNFSVSVKSGRPDVATVSDTVVVYPCENTTSWNLTENMNDSYSQPALKEAQFCYNLSFTCTAVYLGFSRLSFYANFHNNSDSVYIGHAQLRSMRSYLPSHGILDIVVMVCVVLTGLGMGNSLELHVIKEHLKKPKAPAIAMVSQFTIMPLVAYGIIWMLGFTGAEALGMFVMGCSPGGGTSNIGTKLFNGDLSLSVTMTTLSTFISLGALPMWVYTLGTTLPADEGLDRIKIPFLGILQSLAFIIFPLMLGVLVKLKLPKVSKIVKKMLKPFVILVLIGVNILSIRTNTYIYVRWNVKLVLAAVLLPFGGFLFGGLIAWISRFNWQLIKTISLEVGFQNVVVGMLVVRSVTTPPDSDLSIIVPALSTFLVAVPIILAGPLYLIREKIMAKRRAKKAAAKEASDAGSELEPNSDDSEVKLGSVKEVAEKREEDSDVENKLLDE